MYPGIRKGLGFWGLSRLSQLTPGTLKLIKHLLVWGLHTLSSHYTGHQEQKMIPLESSVSHTHRESMEVNEPEENGGRWQAGQPQVSSRTQAR